jgi:hypothetical protein
MTTRAGFEKKSAIFLAQCADPNGPALVWLAEQFVQLRRADCPPTHA